MLRAFEEEHGITVRHLWGMTETSPIGTIGGFKVWTYGPSTLHSSLAIGSCHLLFGGEEALERIT